MKCYGLQTNVKDLLYLYYKNTVSISLPNLKYQTGRMSMFSGLQLEFWSMHRANTSFSIPEYRILGKKGEGTFSEVLKCQNIKDGSYWACKKMKQHYERCGVKFNLARC